MLKKILFGLVVVFFSLQATAMVLAVTRSGAYSGNYGLETTAKNAKYTSGVAAQGNAIYPLIQNGLNAFLAILAILFFGLLTYAGIRWMTAQGNEEYVTKAKDIIWAAIVGLIVIMLAYALTNFVLGQLNVFKSSSFTVVKSSAECATLSINDCGQNPLYCEVSRQSSAARADFIDVCVAKSTGPGPAPQEETCTSETDGLCISPDECKTMIADGQEPVTKGVCTGPGKVCCASHEFAYCANNVKDGYETDIDCGGANCKKCDLQKNCVSLTDCESAYCNSRNVCDTAEVTP